MTEPTGPLKGFRILDLTTVLFGPFGTQTLGDWGAEIIKVESLTGDTWRNSGQFRNRGMSGQFMVVNRNKRSIALDLKHPDGKEVLRRLIPTVDALVSNIRPAGLARLGFGYDVRTAPGAPGPLSMKSSRPPRASPPPWARTTNPPSFPA